jgi:hypothetical protein
MSKFAELVSDQVQHQVWSQAADLIRPQVQSQVRSKTVCSSLNG